MDGNIRDFTIADADSRVADAGLPRVAEPRAPGLAGHRDETDSENLYRPNALRQLDLAQGATAEPLRLERYWIGRVTWLVLATFIAAIAASVLVPVPEYASGRAVVRDGRSPHPVVIAIFPARYRTRLHPGMRMRLEVPGRPRAHQWLVLDAVTPEAVVPVEARRLLGAAGRDAVTTGSLVVITAKLPAAAAPVPDGVSCRAEVLLRTERLLFTLLPSLRRFSRGANA